jgi:hypothetical protein
MKNKFVVIVPYRFHENNDHSTDMSYQKKMAVEIILKPFPFKYKELS